MEPDKLLVIGCGILKNEVQFLVQQNKWNVDSIFLDSTHHCDFSKLAGGLNDEIKKHKDRDMFILYGACHPIMDQMLNKAGTFRVEGQNCIEMLLGKDLFMEKLLEGCFFLLEDWAVRWEYLLSKTYPRCRPEIMKEIFNMDRKFILALRTPCSGDFSLQAQNAAKQMQVPLKWMDVSLDHFEGLMENAIKKKKDKK